MSPGNWEEVARKKREDLLARIPTDYRIQNPPPEHHLDVTTWPRESGWFTDKELDITESTATSILNKIASKEWTSEDVTRAFCKRAAAAHQLVSSILQSCEIQLKCATNPLDIDQLSL